MKELYKDFLFSRHILVASGEPVSDPFPALVALGQKFGIRIHKNAEKADESMIRDAARNLGEYVPEPFYRGFPDTVRELTPSQLLFDQLHHYTNTYGCGWFDEAGHSEMEGILRPRREAFARVAYNEKVSPKDFDILSEEEALKELKEALKGLLASNRPLNPANIAMIQEAWKDFGGDILPEWMPCKDTVIFMLYDTRNLSFCKYLKLSDVIKLLNYIQYTKYHSENLKKLNLRNQDRKLITRVIDELVRLDLEAGKSYCDFTTCFEKRKIWCGLFHHIHYRPKTSLGLMTRFISDVRSNVNVSAYHYVEQYMRKGQYQAAANTLRQMKGQSELIRHLNYILSRCSTDDEIKGVFKCLE